MLDNIPISVAGASIFFLPHQNTLFTLSLTCKRGPQSIGEVGARKYRTHHHTMIERPNACCDRGWRSFRGRMEKKFHPFKNPAEHYSSIEMIISGRFKVDLLSAEIRLHQELP